MTTAKTTAWLTGAAAVLSLGYVGLQHHEASLLRRELALLGEQRDQLQARLQQSDQRVAQLGRELTDAAQRAAAPKPAALPAPAPRPLTATPDPAADAKRAANAARMAQMKPLLEAGQPIKGAAVVLVDGKAVSRPVELVMGKETRIEATDEGTYVIKPTLNPNGSVRYAVTLTRKSPGSEREEIQTFPAVTQTPWDSFLLGLKDGATFAFDPDKS